MIIAYMLMKNPEYSKIMSVYEKSESFNSIDHHKNIIKYFLFGNIELKPLELHLVKRIKCLNLESELLELSSEFESFNINERMRFLFLSLIKKYIKSIKEKGFLNNI